MAFGWIALGVLAAIAFSKVLDPWLPATNQHHGSVAVGVGFVVLLADTVCRMWDRHETGASRFFSGYAGGSV